MKTMKNMIQVILQGKRFMLNKHLYQFNCPLSNDCSFIIYVNGGGSAALAY